MKKQRLDQLEGRLMRQYHNMGEGHYNAQSIAEEEEKLAELQLLLKAKQR